MTEYENDSTREYWEAAFEADPLAATAQIAEAVHAQYAQPPVDADAIAAQAAVMATQYAETVREHTKAAEEARIIDMSLAAKHGKDWPKVSAAVQDLLQQPDVAAEFTKASAAGGVQAAADYMDSLAEYVKQNHTADAKEWNAIKNARTGGYADNPEGWLASAGVDRGGMGRRG